MIECSFIIFDIDFFKNVNDSYGHDVGDSVLVELSQLVHALINEKDVFVRWGGEEFVIVMHSNLLEAKKRAENLRKEIEEYHFSFVKKVTCSFGISDFCYDKEIKETIMQADQALYKSKKEGRNCVNVSFGDRSKFCVSLI